MKATSAQTSLLDPREVAVFNEASSNLVCQCGCHMVVSVCNHIDCPFCVPVRKQMESMIRQGSGAEQILTVLKQEHGSQVLAAPSFAGWGQVAWLAPGVVLLIALAVAVARLVSWVRKPERAEWKPR